MTKLNDVICFHYKDFNEFMTESQYCIYRYWVYRRGFTPYEQDKKFTDESMFEDTTCKTAYIRELINLPDGDILIGFLDADSININNQISIQYYKLSEIRLEYYEGDQEADEED